MQYRSLMEINCTKTPVHPRKQETHHSRPPCLVSNNCLFLFRFLGPLRTMASRVHSGDRKDDGSQETTTISAKRQIGSGRPVYAFNRESFCNRKFSNQFSREVSRRHVDASGKGRRGGVRGWVPHSSKQLSEQKYKNT